jgi:hypothetical protein
MAVSRAAHQYSWRDTGSHGGEPAASLLLSATCVILLSSHPNTHVFFPVSMEYCFHKMLPKLGGPRCRWVGGHPLEFVHIWIKNVWIMWIFVVCAPSQMFRPRSVGPPLCPKGHFLAVRIGGWAICNFFLTWICIFFCKKNHRSINDHQQRYKEQQR